MPDFTYNTYTKLIEKVQELNIPIEPFNVVMKDKPTKYIVLRHDVDKYPGNSVRIAEILNAHRVRGTFYFRSVSQSFHPNKIEKIAELGHEIGYHYEDLSLAKGDIQKAVKLFEKHLDMLRQHAEVTTICMHGSPLSKFDNRALWKVINYKDYGIIGEPYLDIDFNEVLYLTDTGRRWDNKAVSVRDKTISSFEQSYSSSYDIMEHIHELPNKIMFNTHPQRWNNNSILWFRELILQNIKNVIKKKFLVKDL